MLAVETYLLKKQTEAWWNTETSMHNHIACRNPLSAENNAHFQPANLQMKWEHRVINKTSWYAITTEATGVPYTCTITKQDREKDIWSCQRSVPHWPWIHQNDGECLMSHNQPSQERSLCKRKFFCTG